MVANKLWLNDFGSIGVEVLILRRFEDHPILLTTTKTFNGVTTRRRIFHYEVKWAREDDGEYPINMVWQRQVLAPKYWEKFQLKLAMCIIELIK